MDPSRCLVLALFIIALCSHSGQCGRPFNDDSIASPPTSLEAPAPKKVVAPPTPAPTPPTSSDALTPRNAATPPMLSEAPAPVPALKKVVTPPVLVPAPKVVATPPPTPKAPVPAPTPRNVAAPPTLSEAPASVPVPKVVATPPPTPKAPAPTLAPRNVAAPPTLSEAPASVPVPAPENNAPRLGDGNDSLAFFDVMNYGATGDGVADDTQAFKMAWDEACQSNVTSVLLVPRHYSFLIQSAIFTGPCQNALTFQIEGSLMPPDGPDSWPTNFSKRQWLVFYRINGMSMQGGGLIDGRGEKWWELPCKPHRGINKTTLPGPCDSPVAIRFFWSSNLTVQDLKIKNSPQFHFRFDSCSNVHIHSLYIKSPAGSPNTDGIHVENSNDVKIYNSLISNGDDCVSIGAGTYNVDIRNITCGPSHGISIGSLGIKNSRACVSNITVSDSVIKHSDNGVRIKTWQGGYGSVSKVSFNNIHMDTVRNPIIIDQYYCSNKACSNQTSAVYINDISYTNIRGTFDTRSPPMHLACSDSVPCTNLTISDVELFPSQGQRFLQDPFCWNAYGDIKTLIVPPLFCLVEGYPTTSLPSNDVDKC